MLTLHIPPTATVSVTVVYIPIEDGRGGIGVGSTEQIETMGRVFHHVGGQVLMDMESGEFFRMEVGK